MAVGKRGAEEEEEEEEVVAVVERNGARRTAVSDACDAICGRVAAARSRRWTLRLSTQ
jgi:hypothetical protein